MNMNDDNDRLRGALDLLRNLDRLPPDRLLKLLLGCAQGNALLDLERTDAQITLVQIKPVRVRRINVADGSEIYKRAPEEWRLGEAVAGFYRGLEYAAEGAAPRAIVIAFSELVSGELDASVAYVEGNKLGAWRKEISIEWFRRSLAGVKSRMN